MGNAADAVEVLSAGYILSTFKQEDGSPLTSTQKGMADNVATTALLSISRTEWIAIVRKDTFLPSRETSSRCVLPEPLAAAIGESWRESPLRVADISIFLRKEYLGLLPHADR